MTENLQNSRRLNDWEAGWLHNPFQAYIDTVRNVFLSPIQYFREVHAFGDFKSLFSLLLINQFLITLISVGAAVLIQLAFGSFIQDFQAFQFQDMPPEALQFQQWLMGNPMFWGAYSFFAIVIGPIIQVCFTVIIALIMHLFLVYVGGSEKDYMTTLSVYSLGSSTGLLAVLTFVPILGPLIQSFVQLVYFFLVYIGGMAEMHEIPTVKALVAMLIPFAICCCCGGTLFLVPMVIAGLAGLSGAM